MTNGYFQLVHKEDGTYIRLIPTKVEEQSFSIGELMDYLNFRDIEFDIKELNRAVLDCKERAEYKLNSKVTKPFRESYSFSMSEDKMQVVLRFYAPSEGGPQMTVEEVISDLRNRNIRYGINSDMIMEIVQNQIYCVDVIVAKGKEPRHGSDARIEYMFQTDRKAKPDVREDGSVDFLSLNTICHVKEDELLARLIEADPGEDGMNVLGEVLKPRTVKRDHLKFGRNIRLSEDRTEIYSMVNGHVTLAGDKVFVSNVLEVENVDLSTGNIDYNGGICVLGNVFSGLSVKATGDIEIRGVVEGAVIESGGNISIARGMNGMGKGKLVAKGNVISKFLENAEVHAGAFISTESILHCKVHAGSEIEVTGKKGFITGGNVMASNKITVKTLGSPMGAATVVEVGVNPVLKREQADLQKALQEANKVLAAIEPVIAATIQKKRQGIEVTPEQMEHVQKLIETRTQKKDEITEATIRLEELDDILVEGQNPSVVVTGEVFPGTKICIMDVSKVIKDSMKYCRFIRSQGDVKMTAI